MAQFSVISERFDPYKNFTFRLRLPDGTYVAGLSKVSALKRTTEVVKHRDDSDPSSSRKLPGQTEYEAITFERGVTYDVEFVRWANKVLNYGFRTGHEVSLQDFRKDLFLVVYNEAGQVILAYKLYRCWPFEYQALTDLDAGPTAVAIQTLKLENNGWERDNNLGEPEEPLLKKTSLHEDCQRTSRWGCLIDKTGNTGKRPRLLIVSTENLGYLRIVRPRYQILFLKSVNYAKIDAGLSGY